MNPLPSYSCQLGGNAIGPPPQYDMSYNRGVVSPQYVMTNNASPSHFKPIFTTEQYVINTELTSVNVVTAPSTVIVAQRVYKDYLALSILSMLFCFLPVGIAAVVYSCKVIRTLGGLSGEKKEKELNCGGAEVFCGCWMWVSLLSPFSFFL